MKTAKVRMVVEYDVWVPDSWDKHDVEFHRNEGSWCADNAIEELQGLSGAKCLCSRAKFECLSVGEESKV